MKRAMALLFVVSALLLPSYFASAKEPTRPVAIVMSCTGEATAVTGEHESTEVVFGLQLFPGYEIRTERDARVELLFEDGNWIEVGPSSRMVVKGTKEQAGGVRGGRRSFDILQSFLKLKEGTGTSSLATLRSTSTKARIKLLAPCETRILERKPFFRWSCQPDPTSLRLTVYDENGIHWQASIEPTVQELRYPDDAPELTPGVRYSWALETSDPLQIPPLRTEALFFEIVPPEEEQSVYEDLDRIKRVKGKESGTSHLLAASIYFHHGLYQASIEEVKRAIRLGQENPALHTLLANLYARTGMAEEAMREYDALLEKKAKP